MLAKADGDGETQQACSGRRSAYGAPAHPDGGREGGSSRNAQRNPQGDGDDGQRDVDPDPRCQVAAATLSKTSIEPTYSPRPSDSFNAMKASSLRSLVSMTGSGSPGTVALRIVSINLFCFGRSLFGFKVFESISKLLLQS